MKVAIFNSEMQQSVTEFYQTCFAAVGIPYSPKDRHAIDYAKEQQYHKICLDTRNRFFAAQHLYRSNGFRETERYNDNDKADYFFELVL